MSQILAPVAPQLPQPPGLYDSRYHAQLNDTLRLYFKQLNNSFQQLFQGFNNYGTFYDTTNQTQAAANVALPVTFDTTAENYGISLLTSSQIQVTKAGVYQIRFSVQLDNSGGGTFHAHLWLRVNGVDVPATAGKVVVSGPTDEKVVGWSYLLTMSAGDYFEIMWSVSDTQIYLLHEAAAAPVPEIPSVRLNVFYLFPNDAP